MGTQQFQLKWNNHQSNMVTVFDQLLSSEALVDVTLACEGLSLKAHKIVLSACSPFFQNLFLENPCTHPIVIMKDMKYAELKAIVDFIYKGEVNVSHYQLNGLLKTAELLNIKGLIEVADENINYEPEQPLQNEVTEQQSVDTSQTIPFSSAEQKKVASPSLHKKRRGKRKRRISNDSTSTENEEIPPKLQESRINDKILSETISDSHNEVSVSQQEQFQVSSDHPNSSVSQNLFFPSTQEDTFVNVEEPPEDEQNYSESPDFVKQIILTESKSLLQDCASQGPTICSVSSQGTVQAEFRNSNFINTGSQDSEKLVSCSTLSETSTPNFLDDEMPDIKPIVIFDEFGNPTARDVTPKDIAHASESGVLSLPGPSIYQLDKQSSELKEPDSHGKKIALINGFIII
ncbi:longitudinals lacking protein, isoforms H/M/V-like isoform X1 [Centruroides sculpturatus]|uniref:longitudinals lacking protein, isoforms H/M/V-like isoform X1 n=1 Tax=Centruroides sculpturatus TaxID=218467 RepID=UPI000C6E652A|nr:longitudinals lacking protein, isoforms H/M/V-like isoform X1 [Centruroides sculpturatus]XP_023222356.1 longitudinals lacking protein, isoforms H/M/V-like isoform X1 [Centruroides sculpturatus]XP_023222357.1 longitudinals lacking protein, isoforms H/M/V-like isoform X1 [Centruroides sculpturatus]